LVSQSTTQKEKRITKRVKFVIGGLEKKNRETCDRGLEGWRAARKQAEEEVEAAREQRTEPYVIQKKRRGKESGGGLEGDCVIRGEKRIRLLT